MKELNATPNWGDKGQRYEVHAKDATKGNRDRVIGWTNNPTGGMIVGTAISNQFLSEIRVVDRTPGIEKLIDDTKFKAGCRKCVEQVYAGKDHCSYCHYQFPMAQAVN